MISTAQIVLASLIVLGVLVCGLGGLVSLYSYRSLVGLLEARKASTGLSEVAARVQACERGLEALNGSHVSLQRKFSKRDLDERRSSESGSAPAANGTVGGQYAHLFDRPES